MNPLRGRCRFVSAVFSRALNYDTVFKDLSNLRVFAVLNRLHLACCRLLFSFIQRSLRFYTEFFLTGNNFKNIFCLLPDLFGQKALS
jgi:hypothetical protein